MSTSRLCGNEFWEEDKPMESKSENTKRIAKNTLLLYVRMLFGMLVSLYTSRVVLQALGVEDYGIYNVVGGFVAMFSMISSSLSASTGRFLTYELGKGDMEKLQKVFSTSLIIHIGLAILIVILAESLGVWFLNTHMTIPADRLYAANWVFHASIISFIFSLLSVPFNATIISHEHMNIYAYAGIFDILLRLLIVLFVAYIPWIGDKLICYSSLLIGANIGLQLFYMWYCHTHFMECKLKLTFYKKCFSEMGAFAVWNFIGCTASLLRDQGVNILLNIFIGPIINAARGIAVSVNTAIGSFAGNFMAALNPQITKSYASKDYIYMNSLIERGARFSYYIMLVFILPVILETEFVLTLWLKEYPSYTVIFVRLVLIASIIDALSNTLITLQNATGRIRNYQLAVGGMLMMNFPVSYLCLKLGFSPVSVYVVSIGVALACLALRLAFLEHMVQKFSSLRFVRKVCFNVVLVTLLAMIIPWILHSTLSYGWLRFIVVVIVCLLASGLSIVFVGCTEEERKFLFKKFFLLKAKLKILI